jgi:hypothetical protein
METHYGQAYSSRGGHFLKLKKACPAENLGYTFYTCSTIGLKIKSDIIAVVDK